LCKIGKGVVEGLPFLESETEGHFAVNSSADVHPMRVVLGRGKHQPRSVHIPRIDVHRSRGAALILEPAGGPFPFRQSPAVTKTRKGKKPAEQDGGNVGVIVRDGEGKLGTDIFW